MSSPRAATSTYIDPHLLIRRVYVARVVVVAAIYLAAVFSWSQIEQSHSLVASLLMTAVLALTAVSAVWSEIYERRLTESFLGLQALFDVIAVTAIVHMTGGGASQFTALYLVVIATAALMLSTGRSLAIAGISCLLFFTEVLVWSRSTLSLGVWLQMGLFAAVAVFSGFVGSRLREARAGSAALAAQLHRTRLQAVDILGNIGSGIITVDADGILLYANPAAERLLGTPLELSIGMPAGEALAASASELADVLVRTARDGTKRRCEATVHVAGRAFPIGLNTTYTAVSAAGAGDDPDGTATAIFQDISDQKRMEDLHMRAERLEAVAELSASLAHEIKNPLAAVRSAVEQLARSPRADRDEQTLATLIVRESDRLSRLLNEFLDFARVRVTRLSPVDLASVAKHAASLAQAHPDRPATVDVEARVPDEPVWVEGDEDLLHRAVFNLALNAVQASPERGRVRVELATLASDNAPLGLSFDRGGAALRVSDDGDGIPNEIRDRLFDPFFTTKPGGTGLGLSVVHRAIEAHNGFVFVDSDSRGTRVTVLLPSHQSEAGDPV